MARMALPWTAVCLLALLAVPAAHAGGGQAPADAEPALDLPVSLERIQQLLAAPVELGARGGMLRLNIQVRVFAPAPAIRLYRGIDLEHSPPRYGAPVHAEMAALTTPGRLRFRNGAPAFHTGHAISWGGR